MASGAVLADITPVILTYNESANIGRSLERLTWAREVVIVDSGSTDDTLAIAARFPNARVGPPAVRQPFPAMAIRHRRDRGDQRLDPAARRRLHDGAGAARRDRGAWRPIGDTAAYQIAFTYCMDGKPLRASLYPALPVLFRRGREAFVQDGHTEKLRIDGPVVPLHNRLLHDDRKSLERWLQSQSRYQVAEAEKLATRPWSELSWPDRLRCTRVLGPIAVAVHCLFVKGLIFDGTAGLLLYSAACDGRHDPFHAPAAPGPRQMTYVLGLNAYHADAAACLVKDGELVAAAEEERFRRIKHWGGFPSEAIRYCLRRGRHLAGRRRATSRSTATTRANRWRKLAYVLTSGVSPGSCSSACAIAATAPTSPATCSAALPDQKFTRHRARRRASPRHLSSAFLVSPFDEAVVVSVDGFGDFSSAAWGLGEGGKLAVDGRVYFPHSLGIFYQALTQFSAFRTTATSTR